MDQQWLIKVNGVDEIRVDAGQTVVIGRKPLRPVAEEEGVRRLDVDDTTKSMSKRHVRFAVTDAGVASIEDLSSTNGTYVVRDDGELMRVPASKEFQLPRSTMRFQLGDVPVDFLRVPARPKDEGTKVSDLFAYAAPGGEAQQETTPADMSVDDILDLRAGEPTGLLSTAKVRSRIDALHDRVVAETRRQQESDASATGGAAVQDAVTEVIGGPKATPDTASPVAAPVAASPDAGADAMSRFRPGAAGDAAPAGAESASTGFTPVFEPGSVFERLSKGELNKPEPVIEAGGFTSDEAKTTRDYDMQFDIARQRELLPFLALNPSLYPDLYSWLELQGNDDVDRALQGNQGYQDYLAGKGE
ncbi:FHA domain-containing protein [Bifidobacterium sp. 82T24]|nr:FHA domain-containing protein [Bifidobacterium pluvialisilvae]